MNKYKKIINRKKQEIKDTIKQINTKMKSREFKEANDILGGHADWFLKSKKDFNKQMLKFLDDILKEADKK